MVVAAAAAAVADRRVDDLAARIASCRACALSATRRHAVAGVGRADATTVLIGVAPTWRAEGDGRTLSAAATAILDDVGIDASDVFTTTLVRCRPPGGRAPTDDEIASCRPFLDEEIATIAPTRVLALGSFVTRQIAPDAPAFGAWHGLERPLELGGHRTVVVPVLDPEAVAQVPSLAASFWGPSSPVTAVAAAATPVDDDQLGLF